MLVRDLPLHHGAQLAIDTTMVSPLRRDGVAQPRSMTEDEASLETTRRRKERRYPDLSGQFGRARLVVLACEFRGRWSEETRDFLQHLAKAKTRWGTFPGPASTRGCVALAIACSHGLQDQSFCFLEARSRVSSDGCIPLTGEVIGDARYEPASE